MENVAFFNSFEILTCGVFPDAIALFLAGSSLLPGSFGEKVKITEERPRWSISLQVCRILEFRLGMVAQCVSHPCCHPSGHYKCAQISPCPACSLWDGTGNSFCTLKCVVVSHVHCTMEIMCERWLLAILKCFDQFRMVSYCVVVVRLPNSPKVTRF